MFVILNNRKDVLYTIIMFKISLDIYNKNRIGSYFSLIINSLNQQSL